MQTKYKILKKNCFYNLYAIKYPRKKEHNPVFFCYLCLKLKNDYL